ncbi:c-type cytochrome biogenesis protein CcmI [Thiohalorhabdus methylotrophus]|uniref:C-type cytochrome biogenesis protein CcmI n=1 Tax=Thiohalorhabdus methylotrophus TaxID=3242694 RepID=A0ABV4TS72_9GAMM
MTLFWIITAAMILAAVWFIAPALLGRTREGDTSYAEANLSVYRDRLAELAAERDRGTLSEEEYEQGRRELENEIVRDVPGEEAGAERSGAASASGRRTLSGLMLLLPVLAVTLYFAVGRPGLIGESPATRLSQSEIQKYSRMAPEQRISQLRAHLSEHPKTAEAWVLLGQTYRAQEQFGDAVEAYGEARKLLGEEPQLLVQYAEAIALANGRRITERASALVNKALAKDPDNSLGLWLAGSAAMSRGDGEAAAKHWRKLAAQMPPDSDAIGMLKGYIAQAEGVSQESVTIDRPEQTAAAGPSMRVRVDLAAELKETADPGDTVFIFARAAQGPPMPVAVVRKQVQDLPVEVSLNDSQAMMPSRKLSSMDRVVVGARVSKNGQPTAQPGDLEGMTNPLKVKDGRQLSVTIDRRVE